MCHLFRLFLLFLIPAFTNIRLSAQPLCAANSNPGKIIDNQKERIPLLPYSSDKFVSSLPSRVDNSELKYFSDIQRQWLPTCQQFSGIYNAFSYEINRLRDVEANSPSTIYPPSYTFNFLNTNNIYGVSFYYSFEVLKTQGQPDFAHYGVLEDETGLYWMSGYDNYLNAMQNRLHEVYRIPVNTPEGNLIMKNWIHNHLNRDSTGGVAIFGCSNDGTVNIPVGQYEQGKILLLQFGYAATHGLTIAGYDDEVGYDINHDGIITNVLDINNDGLVDMKDWEKGAYIVANSYGADWGNNGFLYVLYSAMAHNYTEGGVWNESCYVLEPFKEFRPQLTLKTTVKYNRRDQLKIMAGISTDTSSVTPQHTIDFLTSMYSGGAYPMKGIETLPDPEVLEMGFDISPLLSFAETGKPAKVFLIVDEMDPEGEGSGSILSYSVIDYTRSGKETGCLESNVKLNDNGLTLLEVNIEPLYQKPQISPSDLNFSGKVPQQFQLEAIRGEAPYRWSLPSHYLCFPVNAQLSAETGTELALLNTEIPQNIVILPFKFPFCGGSYDTIYINHTGFVAFESSEMPYNYTTDGQNVLASVKCIGAAHQELILNTNNHHCRFRTNDTMCEIQWKFEFTYQGSKSLINCGVRLFSNGTFEILYDTLPDVKSYPLARGYSDGTNSKEYLSTIFNLSDYSKKAFRYFPDYVNDKISINQSGLLTLSKQDESPHNEFVVRVTDKNMVSAEKKYILHNGTEIIDKANSGTNQILEFNENCSVDCSIRNYTNNSLIDPVLYFRIDTTLVTVADTIFRLENIAPGDSLSLKNVFSFFLKNKPPDHSFITYSILLKSNGFSAVKSSEIFIGRPVLETMNFKINDYDDKSLQPGETSLCALKLMNSGSVITQDLQCEIESDNSLLQVLFPELIKISDIGAGCQFELNFFLQADKSAELGTKCNLAIKLNNNHAPDTTFTIHLELNKRPVYIVNISPSSHTSDSLTYYLNKKGINSTITSSFPPLNQLDGVRAIFVTSGFENDPKISTDESDLLINYLGNGGNLYFESKSAFWLPQMRLPIMDSMGADIKKEQMFYIDSLLTEGSVFSEGKLDLITSTPKFSLVCAYPHINAETYLVSASSPSSTVQWGNQTAKCTAIGSFVAFGQLRDRPDANLKEELIDKYISRFNLNTCSINPLFHTFTNVICYKQTVRFKDDSFDNIMYRKWYFPGGDPEYSVEAEPLVNYTDSGVYNVQLTVSNGTDTVTILRKDYIEVYNCIGKGENQNEDVQIFPNPSSGCYSVILPANLLYRRLQLAIYDCNGHMVLTKQVPDASTSLIINISEYPSGIYLLRLTYNSGHYNFKLIKH